MKAAPSARDPAWLRRTEPLCPASVHTQAWGEGEKRAQAASLSQACPSPQSSPARPGRPLSCSYPAAPASPPQFL